MRNLFWGSYVHFSVTPIRVHEQFLFTDISIFITCTHRDDCTLKLLSITIESCTKSLIARNKNISAKLNENRNNKRRIVSTRDLSSNKRKTLSIAFSEIRTARAAEFEAGKLLLDDITQGTTVTGAIQGEKGVVESTVAAVVARLKPATAKLRNVSAAAADGAIPPTDL